MDIIKGTVVKGKARRPKTYPQGRVCLLGNCEVRLSRYNRNEYCFNHAPIRYPHVRGRSVPQTPKVRLCPPVDE